MGEIQKFDLVLLNGGLNVTDRATHIEDAELAALENFYIREQKLRRRSGTKRITESEYDKKLTSLFAYKRAVGSWILLVGTRSDIAKLDGFHIVPLGINAFQEDMHPWVFRQYNNIVYAARKNLIPLQRVDGDAVMPAGIPKPASAPAAAQGAAGLLVAGTYKYVVTFVNRTTGAESDFSAEASVTVADLKQVSLTGIPVSTNLQVNGRRLYRSVVNGSGVYYFVKTIEDNTTTTFDDNVEERFLGDAVSVENGLPPSDLRFIEFWRERLWGTDGRDLFASRAGYPEQFSGNFLVQISPDDGHEMRGMLAFGDKLLVGKTNTVHYGTGFDVGDFNFDGVLTDKHGVGSGHSMATAEGLAMWLGMDDFYVSDGQDVKSIGTPKIRPYLEAIPESARDRVVSYVVPSEGWYVTTVPQDESDGFDVELIFNYKKNTWQTCKRAKLGAPVFAGEFVDENFNRIQYGCFDSGHLYQLHTGNDDDGEPIVAKLRTKDFGFDSNNVLKWLRRLHLLCDTVAENVIIRLYRDEGAAPLSSREVSLAQLRPWKRMGLSSKGRPGATVAVEVEYDGESPLDVNALSFELVNTGRSSKAV